MRDACYRCIHRREVVGSAHSSCVHPVTTAARVSPFVQLAGQVGKRGGPQLLEMADSFGEGPGPAQRALHVEAHDRGVSSGWFVWPVNFDPVWLVRCDGFTPEAVS